LLNRQYLPANWVPPFIPHFPGAEGLALLQTGAVLKHSRLKSRPIKVADHLPDSHGDIENATLSITLAFRMNGTSLQNIVIFAFELGDGRTDALLGSRT
jgi:hypothetical protein